MAWLKTFLFLTVLVIVFLSAALAVNQQQVALGFVDWQTPFTLSIFWWLLMALILGIVLGWLYNQVRHLPLRLEVRALKKSLAATESLLEKKESVEAFENAPKNTVEPS
jgi:uncharacterized membrane protein YciS (DUF1049 family)